MTAFPSQYFVERTAWRAWLTEHFETAPEIWLEYPKKHTGKPRIIYNDAVEEALCFGWIDSTVRAKDADTTMQRFCPRRAKSSFSQPNRERLAWLLKHELIHASIRDEMASIVAEPFEFPADIMELIQADAQAWQHYQAFSPSYQRIRIAFIAAARKRPEEFHKRLHNFLSKTRENKLIKGFGGIDKYY
ncbi:MAG: YdeI/OmpD-associated family protein [Bacteroidota bacterium]